MIEMQTGLVSECQSSCCMTGEDLLSETETAQLFSDVDFITFDISTHLLNEDDFNTMKHSV